MAFLFGIYFGIGLLFGFAFVMRGCAVVDPAAKSGTIGFRLLILPASITLWPLLLAKWLKAAKGGTA